MNLVFKPHILEKLASKHQVEQHEVEEVVQGDPNLIVFKHTKGRQGEQRFLALGETEGNRLLRIILEKVYDEFIVLSAYDASPAERKRYRRRW